MIAIGGTIDKDEIDLLSNLGRFITRSTDDLRYSTLQRYFWQRGSVVRTSVCSWRTFPDLRLIHGWHVTTSWVRCPLWVNQLGQLSLHPFRVGKWVVIHVITWFTRWRPLNGRLNYVRSVGHGSACEHRLSLWPTPYASLACDMTTASEVAVAAWGALQVLYAFAFATMWLLSWAPLSTQPSPPRMKYSQYCSCFYLWIYTTEDKN